MRVRNIKTINMDYTITENEIKFATRVYKKFKSSLFNCTSFFRLAHGDVCFVKKKKKNHAEVELCTVLVT
jgi:hypothetical protein